MTHIPRPDGTYYNSACSAALISPTWIITAGHCFHDVNRVPVNGPPLYATIATLTTDGGDLRAPPRTLARPPRPTVRAAGRTEVRHRRAAIDHDRHRTGAAVQIGHERQPAGSERHRTRDRRRAHHRRLGSHLRLHPDTEQPTVHRPGHRPGGAPQHDRRAGLLSRRRHQRVPVRLRRALLQHAPRCAPLLVATESTGPECPHSDAETTARVDNITEWIRTIVPDLP